MAPMEEVEVIEATAYDDLVEALTKYGSHLPNCGIPQGTSECNCGWLETYLAATRKGEERR